VPRRRPFRGLLTRALGRWVSTLPLAALVTAAFLAPLAPFLTALRDVDDVGVAAALGGLGWYGALLAAAAAYGGRIAAGLPLGGLVVVLQQVAAGVLVHRLHEKTSLVRSLRAGFPAALPIACLTLVAIPVVAAGLFPAALVAGAARSFPAVRPLLHLEVTVPTVIFVVALWLFVLSRWWLALPILAVEGGTVRAALRRSVELTRGHWFGMLGLVAWLVCASVLLFLPLVTLTESEWAVVILPLLLVPLRAALLAETYAALTRSREGDPEALGQVFA